MRSSQTSRVEPFDAEAPPPVRLQEVDPAAAAQAHHRHYPALDGLRGVALLSVFIAHFYSMIAPDSVLTWGGWLGVDLFFVLSGFLITGILFDSLPQPRYFRNFYIRRALRIFPLYYTPWILFLLLTPWVHPLWTRFDIARVFYYGNLMSFEAARHPEIQAGGFMFFFPKGHFTGFNDGALWSLCLEEQFYLVWPMLIFLLRDRRRIMSVCAVGIVASLALNTALSLWATRVHADREFLYEATYTHASPMLFGAWLALWIRGRTAGRAVSPGVYWTLILAPACVLFGSLALFVKSFDAVHPVVVTYGYTCSGLMSLGIVLAAIQQDGLLKRIFSLRWLTGIGTVSYGLYIIHGYLMGAFRHHVDFFQRHGIALLMPVSALLVTYLLALLSYRFLELPFLRLKDRYAPTRHGAQGRTEARDRDGLGHAGISNVT